jgi:ankyrin repeat protein
LNADGIWYEMDAGKLHTAANFGRFPRIQLVVRKLMSRPILKDPINVKFTSTIPNPEDRRFVFDNTLSPLLNTFNKLGVIDNFSFGDVVYMTLENNILPVLKQKLPIGFDLEIV